ncbi:MAG: hypothetical protein MZU95_14620 [Desulfomicrobium escambiense]|nr:hypothetical protein [Desulfomicrobium escambiense]
MPPDPLGVLRRHRRHPRESDHRHGHHRLKDLLPLPFDARLLGRPATRRSGAAGGHLLPARDAPDRWR